MTRFARAKGSKSSNERLPNESTPWHLMKQQLESTLQREQDAEPQTKTKSAKQLLNEKDDLYYAKSVGNVATDWAEFEPSKSKANTVKQGKVKKKVKDQMNTKFKKTFKKSVVQENSGDNTNIKQESVSNSLKPEKNFKEKKFKQRNNDAPVDSDSKQFKDKKRKVKAENVDNDTTEEKVNKKQKVKSETVTEDNTEENIKFSNKLSKRQKRNQKKQTQKNEDKNVTNTATFNAEGNDWNNSISFNKKVKFDDNQNRKYMNSNAPNNFKERWPNSELNRKNFNRFGNNVPRKFQKKTAKVRDDNEHKRRKPNTESMKVTINGMDVEIVKCDGFPVKKEDAERLAELRKKMVLKGIPKSEIDAAMKLERRKCEKALARIRKQVCFHCRKAGHNLSDCPELGKEEAGTGICFKCGSTEHTHFECKVNKSDDYRYAKCFICREQGHIAKQCPDNPKGLYPDGGSCKICGDVTHLKKDCPDLVKEKEETTITLSTIKDENLEVLDGETTKVKSETKPSKKIVKF